MFFVLACAFDVYSLCFVLSLFMMAMGPNACKTNSARHSRRDDVVKYIFRFSMGYVSCNGRLFR